MTLTSLVAHPKGRVVGALLGILSATILAMPCASAEEPDRTIIHAAPYGDDEAGDGSADNPYATIQRAQEAAPNTTEDVTVLLREGVYRITEPLEFDKRDSGRNGHEMVY